MFQYSIAYAHKQKQGCIDLLIKHPEYLHFANSCGVLQAMQTITRKTCSQDTPAKSDGCQYINPNKPSHISIKLIENYEGAESKNVPQNLERSTTKIGI